MQPRADTVTDIWFRCAVGLEVVVQGLGLTDVVYDAEDYWEWAIGTLDGVQLDIARTHTRSAASVDTRIFCYDGRPFPVDLKAAVVERLIQACGSPVSCGRWLHRQGNDYDLQVVERFGLAG